MRFPGSRARPRGPKQSSFGIENRVSARGPTLQKFRNSRALGTVSIPEWIRTTNLRLRRPTLYPVELRGRNEAGSREQGVRGNSRTVNASAETIVVRWFGSTRRRDLAGRPRQLAAAEQVEVQMVDRLAAVAAAIDHHAIAAAELQFAGQIADHQPQMWPTSSASPSARSSSDAISFFGNHQHVRRRLRRDVAKRQAAVVLVDDLGRDFLVDDLLENGFCADMGSSTDCRSLGGSSQCLQVGRAGWLRRRASRESDRRSDTASRPPSRTRPPSMRLFDALPAWLRSRPARIAALSRATSVASAGTKRRMILRDSGESPAFCRRNMSSSAMALRPARDPRHIRRTARGHEPTTEYAVRDCRDSGNFKGPPVDASASDAGRPLASYTSAD